MLILITLSNLLLHSCLCLCVVPLHPSSPPAPLQVSISASWASASPSCFARPSADCANASGRTGWRGRNCRTVIATARQYTSSPSPEAFHGRTVKMNSWGFDAARSQGHHRNITRSTSPHHPIMRWLYAKHSLRYWTNQATIHLSYFHFAKTIFHLWLCVSFHDFQLEHKLEDLPPAYTEYNVPVYPMAPPPSIEVGQPQTQLQQ